MFDAKQFRRFGAGALALGLGVLVAFADEGPMWRLGWKIHDMSRPKPVIITPGTASTAEQPGTPPSDAIVLFDGKDLSQWTSADGKSEAPWIVKDGYMESAKSSIRTKESFADVQLHVEWAEPPFMAGRYEVQVLDSYDNETYADGQCGAIYGQHPPLVNACRPPQQWQTYDIIFHAPQFEGDKLTRPGTVTVLQNGVLVQDHWEIEGETKHKALPKYTPHPNKLPLELQFHGNQIHYRNIWIRPLEALQAASVAPAPAAPAAPPGAQ
jgi:hypothetical protein